MAESPTYQEIIKECAQIEQYVAVESSMTAYIDRALADVKRYLLTSRGIKWATVYSSTDGDYFADTDGIENNKDQLQKAIRLMTVAIIYKDNAQESAESIWWDLYKEYKLEAESIIDSSKLDVDTSGDGTIDSTEEGSSKQAFFSR